MVLTGCGDEEAEQKRVELQNAIDVVHFEARPGRRIPLGMSVGTALYPRDGDSYDALSQPLTAGCIAIKRTASSTGDCSRAPAAGP